MNKNTHSIDLETVRQKVREEYGKIAQQGGSCCGNCDTSEKLASHIGYSEEELSALPEGANMGLSCGNPNALAGLKQGEVVLDLGSGGGFDIFIAGPKVGPTGRAIGVDMTPDMLAKARNNIVAYRERTGLDNVEFRLGEIESLPVGDATVDVVISNCVINLSPDKPRVWNEMIRVLKPGGRLAVSDLALLQPLPPAVTEMVEALVGCVGGAALVSETEKMARNAGFSGLTLVPKTGYIDGMVDWQDPLYQKILAALPPGSKPSDYIVSLEVTATKPVPSEPRLKPAPGLDSEAQMMVTPAVSELIAIGAAIACNCEPCLKYHYSQAQKLGVSKEDMASAVGVAAMVKDSPHQAILRLADRLTGASLSAPVSSPDPCCGANQDKPGCGCSS
jgi:AhpD family alkylhydroperoxidase